MSGVDMDLLLICQSDAIEADATLLNCYDTRFTNYTLDTNRIWHLLNTRRCHISAMLINLRSGYIQHEIPNCNSLL